MQQPLSAMLNPTYHEAALDIYIFDAVDIWYHYDHCLFVQW
jgi:hypothetical protein